MSGSTTAKLDAFKTNRYLCIEYPGYVKNVDKMVETLGGEEQLSDIYFNTKRRIELHLRPSDPYCHSVCGDLQPSRSLLLKLKRKRRKKPTNEAVSEWQYEQEVIGLVHNTYRFVSLMDFQYMTPEPLQNAFSNIMTSSLLEEQHPLHMVPAIFSRIDVQGSYNYHPESINRLGTKGNPAHKETISQEEEIPHKQSDSRMRKRRPSEAMAAIFSSKEVPKEPGIKCRETVEDMSKRFSWVESSVEELRELFKERPLWSRTALICHLSIDIKNERLKQFLPYVAFYWLNGPWRALWNRFDYDPRKCPEAKMYQICDFRVRNKKDSKGMPILPLRSSKISSLPVQLHRYKPSAAVNVDNQQKNEAKRPSLPPEDLAYTFHADKLPRARQIMYQLCDLYDDEIQAIIAENNGKEKKCTEKHGWFDPGVIDKVRAVMVKKVEARIEKEIAEKAENSMGEEADPSDVCKEYDPDDNEYHDDEDESDL